MGEIWYPEGRTRDLGPSSQVGPGTLKVRPKTWGPYYTSDPRPRTLKEEPGKLMIAETGDPKQTSLVEPGTQEL